jgi:CO/xanthine dehydrogenase Mo-binding subunit
MYAEGQVKGAMHMGLSFAAREGFIFDQIGRVINNQLRTYKVTRFGENPEFKVAFIQTPSKETAYGLRGIGELALIGMPAALANALSRASGVELNHLPLVPELIWRVKTGEQS